MGKAFFFGLIFTSSLSHGDFQTKHALVSEQKLAEQLRVFVSSIYDQQKIPTGPKRPTVKIEHIWTSTLKKAKAIYQWDLSPDQIAFTVDDRYRVKCEMAANPGYFYVGFCKSATLNVGPYSMGIDYADLTPTQYENYVDGLPHQIDCYHLPFCN